MLEVGALSSETQSIPNHSFTAHKGGHLQEHRPYSKPVSPAVAGLLYVLKVHERRRNAFNSDLRIRLQSTCD